MSTLPGMTADVPRQIDRSRLQVFHGLLAAVPLALMLWVGLVLLALHFLR